MRLQACLSWEAINLYLSVLSIVLIGCMSSTLSFDLDTMVTPDGMIVRTTRIDTNNQYNASNYTLLPGGLWHVEVKKWHPERPAEKLYIYQIKKRYQHNEHIPSDYVRKSEINNEISINTIKLNILNFGFLKFFS